MCRVGQSCIYLQCIYGLHLRDNLQYTPSIYVLANPRRVYKPTHTSYTDRTLICNHPPTLVCNHPPNPHPHPPTPTTRCCTLTGARALPAPASQKNTSRCCSRAEVSLACTPLLPGTSAMLCPCRSGPTGVKGSQ
jgi:hypothetical protein